MKKTIVLLICFIFFITGCTSKEVSKEKKIYTNYISELKKVNKSTENIPFNIEINLNELTDELYMYQFIMDNVKEDIYDVEAIVIHNKKTEDIFPSIGIFDEKEKLLVNKKPSGIVLVGYIDSNNKDASFKALIKYKDSKNKKHKVYYVTK